MVDDDGASASLACWRHHQCNFHLNWATSGETLDLVLSDRTTATLDALLLRTSFFRVDTARRWFWGGVVWFLSVLTTMSLNGVEQRGLDSGRMMIYRRMTEDLSGIVVALTAGQSRLVRWFLLKMGLRKTAVAIEFAGLVVLLACHRAASWSLQLFWWGTSVCCQGMGPCS
jgi:hypothetical protein